MLILNHYLLLIFSLDSYFLSWTSVLWSTCFLSVVLVMDGEDLCIIYQSNSYTIINYFVYNVIQFAYDMARKRWAHRITRKIRH